MGRPKKKQEKLLTYAQVSALIEAREEDVIVRQAGTAFLGGLLGAVGCVSFLVLFGMIIEVLLG